MGPTASDAAAKMPISSWFAYQGPTGSVVHLDLDGSIQACWAAAMAATNDNACVRFVCCSCVPLECKV